VGISVGFYGYKKANAMKLNNASPKVTRRGFVRKTAAESLKMLSPDRAEARPERPVSLWRNELDREDSGTKAARAYKKAAPNLPIESYRKAAASSAAPVSLPVLVMNRLCFGTRKSDLEDFIALGEDDQERYANWLDKQLTPSSVGDMDCEARILNGGFYSLGYSLEEAWAYFRREYGGEYSVRTRPMREVERLALLRATYSKRQLQEVLVDFWHNHFNVYGWDYSIAPVFMNYDEMVIRRHILGNFREFVEAVGRHTAMLYYLDNYTNTSSGFNENYARELFELHTLGAENYYGVKDRDEVPTYVDGTPRGYVDADVYDAAECFTGWTVSDRDETGDTGSFIFRNDLHSQGEKRILGRVIAAFGGESDGITVFDMLASHPGTARHICRKLCRRLVMDNPPERLVSRVADVFLENVDAPDQLQKVTRSILESDEFLSSFGNKVKRPFEVAASALRASDSEWPFDPEDSDTGRLLDYLSNAGQALFRHSPPDGYSDYKEDWLSTNPIMGNWRMLGWLVEESAGDLRHLRIEQTTPTALRTANELVDYWVDRILGRSIDESDRDNLVNYMAHGRNPNFDTLWDSESEVATRLRGLVALILMSPYNFER